MSNQRHTFAERFRRRVLDGNDFQTWKTIAVIFAFMFSTLFQWLFPLAHRPSDILKNWKLNLPFAFANAVIVAALCTGCMLKASAFATDHSLGLCNVLASRGFSNSWVALGTSILVLDLSTYAWHVANHKLPFLWRFHSVHHSDEVFEASTALRFHAGEIIISLVVRVIVVALFGLPVMGILAFESVYAFFNFFEHGDIRLSRGLSQKLGRIFITPDLHRFHHSADREHLNRNFGTIFSIWDRVFRTISEGPTARVGLPYAAPWAATFVGLLKHPFLNR